MHAVPDPAESTEAPSQGAAPSAMSPIPIVHASAAVAARACAEEIADLIEAEPQCVLGVATGGTMTGLYGSLKEVIRERELDLSGITCFALDEYLGLPEGDPRLFRSVLETHLVREIGLLPAQLVTPDPALAFEDPSEAAEQYEAALAGAGGVDLQLLGIGRNGHVAFNEPGADPAARTHVLPLEARTREDAAATFGGLELTPRRAVTVGVGTILDAKRLRLLAFGAGKAGIVARALTGPLTPDVPASLLRGHRDLAVHLDPQAAASL